MKFKFYKNEENLTEDEKLCINKSIDLLNPSGKVLRRELRAPYWEGKDRGVSG